MNDEQRQKIKGMRLQGLGYKRIVDTIGLTRDSFRGYCRRNGLDGYGKELIKEHKNIIEEEFLFILCRNCGSPLEQNKLGRNRKYCQWNAKESGRKLIVNHIFFIVSIAGKSLSL